MFKAPNEVLAQQVVYMTESEGLVLNNGILILLTCVHWLMLT